MVVDAEHHLALAATHEVGHPLVVLERKVHSVAGGLPVRRIHVVKRVRTIIAFSTFKRGEVFDVSTGQAQPGGREAFLVRSRLMAGPVVAVPATSTTDSV
jgi:hypothetical protein